jgi:hypothetical protein
MIKDFNYWLTGTGWAEAFFSSDTQNVRFELSYLSDPLTELLVALTKMLKGESEHEEVAFWDEPGLRLLAISKSEDDHIDVSILSSDSWGDEDDANVPLAERRVVYADRDTLTNFALVICTGIDSLLERHTLKEYKEKWYEYPFPLEIYEQLKQAVSEKRFET